MSRKIHHTPLLLTILAGLATALATLGGCASTPLSPWEKTPIDPTVREKTVQVMGAPFILRLWLDPKDRRNVESLLKPAILELQRIARITDTDNPKSELSHLNALAAAAPVQVSPELAALLVTSQQLYQRTGGLFDITFAPIQEQVESYGPDAGLDGGDKELGPAVSDNGARNFVGNRNWTYNPADRKVLFLKPGIKLVIKGIAKGYAAQKAAEKLVALKVRGFAVIAGNLFAASGAALKSRGLMCIEDFDHPGQCRYPVTALHPERILILGVAASSDRPGHNYNPKSGTRTFRAGGAAVSGPDGAWTQGAATAASVIDDKNFSDFFKKSLQPLLSGVWTDESSDALQGSLEPYARVGKGAK